MCTAILRLEPGRPVLLAGVRDELTDRAWEPPGEYWPQYPGLIGGRDLQAGGTWLAVSADGQRVACVLNGRGQLAPPTSRRSRGVLPLLAAAGGAELAHSELPRAELPRAQLPRAEPPLTELPLDELPLADLDPFHLLTAEPDRAILQSWDGYQLTHRQLGPGLHFVVNSGLATDLLATGTTDQEAGYGREHELARIHHFLDRFQAAIRPEPRPGQPVAQAWGAWFPLVNGDGIGPDDLRALILRRELPGGRIWGTTSIALVAIWPTGPGAGSAPSGLRYDFTSAPGDPGAWYPVSPST